VSRERAYPLRQRVGLRLLSLVLRPKGYALGFRRVVSLVLFCKGAEFHIAPAGPTGRTGNCGYLDGLRTTKIVRPVDTVFYGAFDSLQVFHGIPPLARRVS